MSCNAQKTGEESFQSLEIEALDTLAGCRDDIIPKMLGMIKRDNTMEASNASCHACGRRFSMRFEIEAKGRSKDASVFRITMECKHCQWNAFFYGYVHKDGRHGLHPQYLPDTLFFSNRQRREG